MKTILKYMVPALFAGALISGCEENIFGPNEGTVSGFVRDNNGKVIEGAQVSATYTLDESTKSINTSSDETGYYILEKVPLTENEMKAEAIGFETGTRFLFLNQDNDKQTLNFALTGAPSYVSHTQSASVIYNTSDTTQTDTTNFSIIVQDDYNSSSSVSYDMSLIFKKTTDSSIVHIADIDLSSNSSTIYIFTRTIEASDLVTGEFSIDIEVSDPDGNVFSGESVAFLEVR